MASTVSKVEAGTDVVPAGGGRSRAVKPGRLPVSEFAADRAGAASPFGDDIRFPLPPALLTYVHPGPDEDPTAAHTAHSH